MKRSLPFVLAALAACGGRVEAVDPPAPAAPTGTVTVDGAEKIVATGGAVSIRLRVSNGTSAPAFVYSSTSSYRLDEGTLALTLVMHQVPTPPTGTSADCHVRVPQTVAIPARTSQTIDVALPAVWGEPAGGGGPVRELPIARASHVDVTLGWSDRPIVLTRAQASLCVFDAETAMRALERGVAAGAFDL